MSYWRMRPAEASVINDPQSVTLRVRIEACTDKEKANLPFWEDFKISVPREASLEQRLQNVMYYALEAFQPALFTIDDHKDFSGGNVYKQGVILCNPVDCYIHVLCNSRFYNDMTFCVTKLDAKTGEPTPWGKVDKRRPILHFFYD